jgi:hypothetical protein
MATDKQLAANRANATKSTGPRSVAGKKRVSQNAVTHGLMIKYSNPELARQLDERARQIASDVSDEPDLAFGDLGAARTVAEAELELARVRRIQHALIERVSAMGSLERPKDFTNRKEMRAWYGATRRWIVGRGPKPLEPVRINPADTMPSAEAARCAEAVRRALPELTKLWHYERRALARRNRGIKALVAGRSLEPA